MDVSLYCSTRNDDVGYMATMSISKDCNMFTSKNFRSNTRRKKVIRTTIGVGWRNLFKLTWVQRMFPDLPLFRRDFGCMSNRRMQLVPLFCILIMTAQM